MLELTSTILSKCKLIIPLDNITKADVKCVGSKAANLGELLNKGFNIPDGFVLTTEAFEHFLKSNGLNFQSSQEEVENATLSTDIKDHLLTIAEPYIDTALAVRSSGIAEDLEGASYAGQYETFLNVLGPDELISAVKKCWASAFSFHVSKYHASKGSGLTKGLAVFIQRLVKADTAGVAFSANPVTGDRNETVINAINGLGDRLVSGKATPDEWVVREDKATSQNILEGSINEDQAIAIANLVKQAEDYFGEPQDIEWAIENGEIYLLQSRPITALPEPPIQPIPVPIDPPPGFWEKDTAHCSYPLSPLFRTTVLPNHEKAMFESMNYFSMLIEGVLFREIGGWLYTRTVPLGGTEKSPDRPPPPSWLMPILIRIVPSIRKRVKGMINVYREDLAAKTVQRWYDEWKPSRISGINQFKSIDLETLSDKQLVDHLNEMLTFIAECSRIHALITAADYLVADFVLTCERILGWDHNKSLELLSGLSLKTTEPTQRLNEIAKNARQNPRILELLDNIHSGSVEELVDIDNEFVRAFNEYLEEFGYRTLRWEINDETLVERPELVLRLIRDQLANNYDHELESSNLEKKRAGLLLEAKDALINRSKAEQEEFELALTNAEMAFPSREDHEYYLHNAPLALLRYTFLEIGKRMVSQGSIEKPDDIFFLEFDEVKTAFNEGNDQSDVVLRRKGELAWVKTHPGPLFYGGPPPQSPSLDPFPYEVQRMMGTMMWMIEGLFASEYLQHDSESSDQMVQGIPASHGQYTGPAKIILDEKDFHKIEAGDVLVCPTTQPAWSVIFPSVGAIITDGGGILSHPAIIAREYQVPAVVATGIATNILQDGQIVKVDGGLGQVTIIKK